MSDLSLQSGLKRTLKRSLSPIAMGTRPNMSGRATRSESAIGAVRVRAPETAAALHDASG
jgi:hypothetical protein